MQQAGHFYDRFASFERSKYCRLYRSKSRQESSSGGIAQTHPHNRRAIRSKRSHRNEIFVLGDQYGTARPSVVPDVSIACRGHSDVHDVLRLVSGVPEMTSKQRRKLRIDEKAHNQGRMTG
jgi:hypothetical protein